MPNAKSVQIHRVKSRPGEGVRLSITDRKKEATGETLTLNMLDAQVPDRRYVADAAAVAEGLSGYRLIFAQTKLGSTNGAPELRSMIDIQIPRRWVEQFLSSLAPIRGRLDEAGALPLIDAINEPSQTAGLSANMAPVAFNGHECCIDFYQMSPFTTSIVEAGGDVYAEPVVRVNLPTGLLVSIARRLDGLLGASQSA